MSRCGRAVFVDFYDYRNVGDDLLFATLARRYPHVPFDYIGDKTDGATFAGLPNVRRLSRIPYVDGVLRRLRLPVRVNDLRRRLRVRRSPLVVRLGGSLYMERGDWRRNAALDGDLVRGGTPAFFLNGNFGPWETAEFLATYERIFSLARDVTVRDSASLEQLRAVGTVRLAPDMLFCVPPAPASQTRQGVVVSLIDLSDRAGLSAWTDGYESAMADLVVDLVARGEAVTLVSFCPLEGDEAAISRVLARIPEASRGSVSTHLYDGDLDAVLGVLRRAGTIVATRFHAMVLGVAFGARVCCVEYSDKLSNALRDLDATSLGWTLPDFVGATRAERLARVSSLEPVDIPGIAARAGAHFSVLDEYLGAPA